MSGWGKAIVLLLATIACTTATAQSKVAQFVHRYDVMVTSSVSVDWLRFPDMDRDAIQSERWHSWTLALSAGSMPYAGFGWRGRVGIAYREEPDLVFIDALGRTVSQYGVEESLEAGGEVFWLSSSWFGAVAGLGHARDINHLSRQNGYSYGLIGTEVHYDIATFRLAAWSTLGPTYKTIPTFKTNAPNINERTRSPRLALELTVALSLTRGAWLHALNRTPPVYSPR